MANRQGNHKSARFTVANATLLPYNNNTFDAVVGNAILHHLPIDISLQECYRVLRPSGVILFFARYFSNLSHNISYVIP